MSLSRVLSLVRLTFAAAALAGCPAGGAACRCDIPAESECIEYPTPDSPLYAQQLSLACSTPLQSLCDAVGGTYEEGPACSRDDLVASCDQNTAGFASDIFWYSTGGDPMDPSSTEPEDDCGSAGTVTRY